MPRRRKAKRKPVRYATAAEEISLPQAAKKKRAAKRAKKAAKKAEKVASKAKKSARKATRKTKPVATKKAPRKRAKPKAKRVKARSARSVRSNPELRVEAAFYQLGMLSEFEFEQAGEVKCFSFDAPPVLAADAAGKLRVVYDANRIAGAKIPAKINTLHETFNGFSPERQLAGVFGKRVPGTTVMGTLRALTYYSDKRIDPQSQASPGHYRHAFETPYPRVLVNPAGLVLIEGGSYEITRAGIVH